MRSLVVEDVAVRYGEVEAVRGASFSVEAGQVFGLLGPNGAGKTSILRVLTTLVRPAGGKAWILGHDVEAEPAAVRRLIGYVPQALSADGSLTGRENILLFARLYSVPRRDRTARIDQLLELMELGPAADRVVRTYSGGMVRRLEIACSLVHHPRFLLLDEPTVGLDPVASRAVWGHLTSLSKETGLTLLVTTHSMHEADEHCQRLAVMSGGVVRGEGTPGELRASLGTPGGTLEDVFAALTASANKGDLRDINRSRRTARRLG